MESRPTGFFEPSGVLIICWGSKGGREPENNGIVRVALEAWAAATAWRLLVVICFMLSGSRIRDEVRRVLIPLQGSHALISLQSQLHQRGLRNPWYTVTATTQGCVCTSAKSVRLRATGILYGNLWAAALTLDWSTGSMRFAGADGVGLLYAMLKLLIRLHHTGKTTSIDYARLWSIADKQLSQRGGSGAKPWSNIESAHEIQILNHTRSVTDSVSTCVQLTDILQLHSAWQR